jgi:hypothetical protein
MSNSTEIKLKKSGATGNTPQDLSHGEVAINYADGKLYYKTDTDTIGYITNQDTFSTISANGELILATNPTDLLTLTPNARVVMTPDVGNKRIFFDVNESAITSFVKKTGDTMTGDLLVNTANVEANYLIVETTLYSGLATRLATPLPNLIAQFTGNTDSYVQVNAQNIDPHGSGDFVVTADVGTDTTFFIDVGIQGSELEQGTLKPLDGYLIVQGNTGQVGGNLIIGTASGTPGQQIRIVSGGYEEDNVFIVLETTQSHFKNNVIVDGSLTGPTVTSMQDYTQSSYNQANTATTNAATADSKAVTAGNYANSAYDQANTATSNASVADSKAVTAGNYANSAYDQANTATSNAATADSKAVTAGNYANSAYDQANTATSNAATAYSKAVSSGVYANGAFVQANAAFDLANTTYSAYVSVNDFATAINVYAYSAYSQANTATTNAATADSKAVTAGNYANSAYSTANSSGSYANSAFTKANSAFENASAASSYANSAYDQANTATTDAATADSKAVTAGNYANSAYDQANTATTNAATADSKAVTAGNYANSAYDQANTATSDAAGASSYANGAFSQANAAFNKANTSVQTSGSNSINGSLTISNPGSTGLTVTGNVIFNNDLTISGNVYLGGNVTSFGANNITIDDSIIYIANNNSGNTSDIGLVGHFISDHYQHTGVVRDHVDGTWKFFSNVAVEPTTTVNFTNAVYDPIKVGGLTADSAVINGTDILTFAAASFSKANSAYASQNTTGTYANSAYEHANASFTKANGAVQTGFTTISANGTSITPSSNADTFTITSAAANGINILNPSSKTIDFGLRTSGVTSGTYGGSTNIPVIEVDGFGRITSAANVAVSTTINLSGGSGSGSVSGGGTLTLSGGTGITTSVSSSTITITNAGVTSWNGATGSVTFGSANVTNALGYTPANKAGDTFSGAVTATSLTTSSGGVTINTSGYIATTTYTTGASTSEVTVDTFATATYRSAKYIAQMTAGSSYHVIELILIHDGLTVYMSQYGEVYTGSSLGTFAASIATGTLSLLFTPASATATTVKLIRQNIVV